MDWRRCVAFPHALPRLVVGLVLLIVGRLRIASADFKFHWKMRSEELLEDVGGGGCITLTI